MKVRRAKPPFLRRSHNEAIGEVKERNPWIEDTWGIGPWTLIHSQTLCTPAVCSFHQPKHTWRLRIPRTTVELHVQYGLAPYEEVPA